MRHQRSVSQKTPRKSKKTIFLLLLGLSSLAAVVKLGLLTEQWIRSQISQTHTSLSFARSLLVKHAPNTSQPHRYWLETQCLSASNKAHLRNLPNNLHSFFQHTQSTQCDRWNIGPFPTFHASRPLSQWLNQHHIKFQTLTKTEELS